MASQHGSFHTRLPGLLAAEGFRDVIIGRVDGDYTEVPSTMAIGHVTAVAATKTPARMSRAVGLELRGLFCGSVRLG